MLNRYREILSLPGALQFAVAGVIARAPMSMVGISIILGIRALYESYTLAGLVSAVQVISFAVCAPLLARLVDRFGQMQVMLPAVMVSAASAIGLIIAVMNLAPPAVLMVLAGLNGATGGSMGALVRARWAYVVHNASQLQVAYAMEAALDEFVFVLGPVAATLLAASVHPLAGLWVAVTLMVVGSLLFLLQRSTQPPTTKKIKGVKQPSVMRNGAMIVLATTYVFTGALFGSMDLSVVAFADEVNMSYMAGFVLASMSLGSLISALFYGARAWNTSLDRLFLIGIFLLALGVSTFILAPNLGILVIFMFIAGLAIAPTMTNVNTIVQRITPAQRLTEGLTWMSTAMTLGVSMGSALTGPMIDNHGHTGGFSYTVLFAWLMVLVALLGARTMHRSIAKVKPHFPEFEETGEGGDPASASAPASAPSGPGAGVNVEASDQSVSSS